MDITKDDLQQFADHIVGSLRQELQAAEQRSVERDNALESRMIERYSVGEKRIVDGVAEFLDGNIAPQLADHGQRILVPEDKVKV